MKVCDVLCPDKKQLLAHVSQSGNTFSDGICGMDTDLRTQLSERSKDFTAVDESTENGAFNANRELYPS